MRRILSVLLIALCITFPCFGDEGVSYNGASRGGTTGETFTCSGGDGLLFAINMENSADVTAANNGCVVATGDGSGTLHSSATFDNTEGYVVEGSYASDHPTSGDYWDYAWTDDLEFDHAHGTIDFWITVDTFANGASVIAGRVDTSNYVIVQMYTGNYLRLTTNFGGTTRNAISTLAGSTGTKYHVIAKWDEIVHGSVYSQICVDTDAGTGNCGTNTSALGTWTGTVVNGRIGEYNGGASDYHLDKIRIYGSWQ